MKKENELIKLFWEEVGEDLHKDISGYFKGCYYIEEALKKVIREIFWDCKKMKK